MKILITALILSSVAFSSDNSVSGFCADVIYVRNLMKVKDVFEMKVLGHMHNQYDEALASHSGPEEFLIQERRKRMEKAKRIKPLWACEIEGVMPVVNELHESAFREVDLCERAKSPQSLVSDLNYFRENEIREEVKNSVILDSELEAAWGLTIEKVIERKDVQGEKCKGDLGKLLKGAGRKYLSAARYSDICELMVKNVNSVQKISEKCSD